MENNPKEEKKIEEGFPGQKMTVLSPDRILKFNKNELAKNLYPTAIGFYPHASFHQRVRKTGSDQYILLYCVSGKGWINVNGFNYTLSSNTYFILPKMVPHSYGSSQKDPWSIYWIHFTGDTANLLYSRLALNTNTVPSIPYNDQAISLFNAIFTLSQSDLSVFEMELLYIKLLQFLSEFIYPKDISVKQEDDKIAESISFMKSNLDRNLSVKEVADKINYSVSRYSELFKEKTGHPPIQYFIQLKIQKSCQFLYFTSMPVKDICKKIGFEDQYYFSRMFKKQMSMSPMQYRKKHKR